MNEEFQVHGVLLFFSALQFAVVSASVSYSGTSESIVCGIPAGFLGEGGAGSESESISLVMSTTAEWLLIL